jgi:hypothetical protein
VPTNEDGADDDEINHDKVFFSSSNFEIASQFDLQCISSVCLECFV